MRGQLRVELESILGLEEPLMRYSQLQTWMAATRSPRAFFQFQQYLTDSHPDLLVGIKKAFSDFEAKVQQKL